MKLKLRQAKKQNPLDNLPANPYHSLSARTFSDTEDLNADPTIVKADITKNLDDNDCISQISIGTATFVAVCLTPDEKHAIVGSAKGIAVMIDIETKTELHKFQLLHPAFIIYMTVMKDGTLLTCSKDGCVEFWNTHTYEALPVLELKGQVSAAVLTADDKFLIVSYTNYHSIAIWDLAKRKRIENVKHAHTGAIHSLAVTKEHKFIASGSADKSISIWTFKKPSLVHCFKNAHYGGVQTVKFSDDEQTVFSSCMNGAINIWDINKKKNVHKFINAHIQATKGLATIREGRFILSASFDCTIGVWDAQTQAHLHTFKGQNSFGAIVTTSDSRCAIVTGDKGAVYFVHLGFQQDTCMLKDVHEKTVGEVRVSHDGTFFVTGADDGRTCVWNLKTRELMQEFKKEGVEVWKVAISHDDKYLAIAFSDGMIDLYSLVEKQVVFTFTEKLKRGFRSIIFSNDGTKLYASSHMPHILIYETSSSNKFEKIENAHMSLVCALDITRNDKFLISGSKDKSIALWELASKKQIHRFENAHDATVWALRLTHDNQYLVSGANDSTIKIWDFIGKRLVHVFQTSHIEGIKGFAISANDSFLMSTDLTCNVEIYNLKTRQRALTYSTLRGSGTSLAGGFCRDSRQILFSRGNSIHSMENPFHKLTVQYSDECSPHSLIRFMPLTSFFYNTSLSHRQNLIKSYPTLKIHPFGWNWFHISALFAPTREMIVACLESEIPFSVDIYEKTPLHYLFENEETEVAGINLIMSKFNTILQGSQNPTYLLKLTGNILFQAIELDNQNVINLLKNFILEPEAEVGASLDVYGDIESNFCLSNSMFYSDKTKENLISPRDSKQKVSIRMLPLELDYKPTSRHMKSLVDTLRGVTLQGIFETQVVDILIKYLWATSRHFFYFLGVLFSIQAILISVYTGLEGPHLGLEITIFVFSMFFLVYELCEMYSGGLKEYVTSVYNQIDIIGAVLLPGTIIANWAGLEDGQVQDWLYSFIVAFTYIRWVSYLRVFKQTRQLIRMIIEILQDIRSFAVILAFIIFGLSLIFIQFDRDSTYATHLFNSYRLLYSDFDADEYNTTGMVFFLVIILALVSIVLLNMLITIMGNTFGEVKEKGVIVDSKELLELISESMNMKKIFSGDSWRRNASKYIEVKNYLFYIEEKVEQEDVYQQNELEDDIRSLKESHIKQGERLEEQGRLIEEQNKLIHDMALMLKNFHNCTNVQITEHEIKEDEENELNDYPLPEDVVHHLPPATNQDLRGGKDDKKEQDEDHKAADKIQIAQSST